jgi:dihydrodipicolinate synthase/N-acetylneuraminate lyase
LDKIGDGPRTVFCAAFFLSARIFMKLSDRNELAHGVYAELLTPRRPGVVAPDTGALLDYVDDVARAGVDGLVLFGVTGEFVHFDMPDRMQALKMAVRRSRVPVLVNVSHSTLDGAIALADDALSSDAAGVLLLPPCFYPHSGEQLAEFYFQFRKNVPSEISVYAYDHPYCRNRVSPHLAEQLFATGEFAGVISASEHLFEQPNVLIADERVYSDALRHGAAGCVSPVAAALPELLVALDRAIRSQSESRAILLNEYLQDFLDRTERLPLLTGISAAAAARGWKLTQAPVPLDRGARHDLDEFVEWMRDWLPAMLKACAL